MHFDLIQIFRDMGLFARGITGVLALFAVAVTAVLLERLWSLARSERQSRRFALDAGPLIDALQFEEARQLSMKRPPGHLGRLLGSGLNTYVDATRRTGLAVPPVELARRALVREQEAIDADLRRGFSILASVGSVAPFVGLLGTVVGIIDAFGGIAEKGSGGLGAVSGGIAEALVVTAVGLLVAIPAVLVFNYLTARVDGLLRELQRASGEFADHLEATHGSKPVRPVSSEPLATPATLPGLDNVTPAMA